MLNTVNRTLGGRITQTASIVDENMEAIYTVTFIRADNREMTIVVDKEFYDKCTHGSRAIFDLDIVMEKGGDVNHYDQKLTKARGIAFVGIDVDARTYKQKMEQDLTYLARYAKPLPAKKKKGRGSARNGFWVVLILVLTFGAGIVFIASVPFLIKYQLSQGVKYANFVVTTGKVIDQSSHQSISNTDKYDIDFTIEYEVDGKKYTIQESYTEHNVSDISPTRKVIYNVDDPSEGYYAEYNNIAKTYLPGMQNNSYISYIVLLLFGVVCLACGGYFVKALLS